MKRKKRNLRKEDKTLERIYLLLILFLVAFYFSTGIREKVIGYTVKQNDQIEAGVVEIDKGELTECREVMEDGKIGTCSVLRGYSCEYCEKYNDK